MEERKLRVMVLAGGPDRERTVSLAGGEQVSEALQQAGYEVRLRDIMPDQLDALDEFEQWGGDVLFPVLHGRWGEGGELQRVLSNRDLAYVGSGPAAASLCINKHLTKLTLEPLGIRTPPAELLLPGQERTIKAPVVIKAPEEGSTIGLRICHTEDEARQACEELSREYSRLMAESYIKGRELTVGVIEDESGQPTPLPPIHIIPAGECYDYDAKYQRDDTQYRFDTDLPEQVLNQVSEWSLTAFRVLGIRHLCRADYLVDEYDRAWFIEVNTMPGFTSHSLLPMAAAKAGLTLSQLTDRLVRRALSDHQPNSAVYTG